MAKEGSVAPKERVNITYKSSTGGVQEDVELPLKMLMVGDFTQQPSEEPLADRKPINIDKDNFNEVMGSQNLGLSLQVKDKLSGDGTGETGVNLKFKNMKDFTPEGIVSQVPEMQKLLELRSALNALKGPLQNKAAFRKKIQELLSDGDARKKLMAELGLADKEEK
jgi:type VI secretion system protein ImpB